jgi:hypothetical protein
VNTSSRSRFVVLRIPRAQLDAVEVGARDFDQADSRVNNIWSVVGDDDRENANAVFGSYGINYNFPDLCLAKATRRRGGPREGELLRATRASRFIPGVSVPVEHGGSILVDGVTHQVPHDLLPDDGDVTIARDGGSTRDSGETKPLVALDAVSGKPGYRQVQEERK